MVRVVVLIIMILNSIITFGNNHYFDETTKRWGIYHVTTEDVYNVLFKKFSASTPAHTPCYNTNDLPSGTSSYFKVTDQIVALVNIADFNADNIQVMAFAHPGELFPLNKVIDNTHINNPADQLPQQGKWFVTTISGRIAYLRVESSYNGKGFAEQFELPVHQDANNLNNDLAKSGEGWYNFLFKLIGGIIGVSLFGGLILTLAESSDAKKSKNLSSQKYGNSSSYSDYALPTITITPNYPKDNDRDHNEYIECLDCDKPHDGYLTFSRGNGDCSRCHGKGEYYTISDGLTSLATYNGVSPITPCEVCYGTTQCQSCGGMGKIKS